MNKFYQLEPDEWLTVCKELKPAELKVLYRLRTLDPFGQHPIKFRVIDLAKDLDMNKGTVSRAVQRLAELGYINLEIVEAIATLTTKSKRLSTDNLVVSTQPPLENIRLSTDNLVVSTQLSCVQTTSAIATQPDSPQIGSEQSTDLSKISLDQLRKDQLDRSNDFSNFSDSDSEISQVATLTNEDAKKCNLTPVNKVIESKPPVKAIAPIEANSPRREIENFVISKLNLEFTSPEKRQHYFDKFTTEHWDKWKFQMKPTVSRPIDRRDPVAEDPFRVENAIASMVRCKDFEAAENRLSLVEKTNPVLANQLREKYLCN
jgi:hypothetical protein